MDGVLRSENGAGGVFGGLFGGLLGGGGRAEQRYAQFGLDDDDADVNGVKKKKKRRPGEVELPPLLMRDGNNNHTNGNIAGAGTSQRSVSPPE